MKNEAAQAGEREALLNQAAGIAMGGWHSVETARAFAAKVSDYILSQGATLPAVQPAESGEPVAYIVRDVEGGSLRDFGDEYSADQYLMQNRARMLKPQVLFCYEKPVAALPQPATTEAGDGVVNKAQVCAALANAGLMLVKTEHGLRVEKAVTGTTAYSVSATPVAAVAQPLTWSEGGDANCNYDHAQAPTPFGRILITWKGWKVAPSFHADEMPGYENGKGLIASTLEEAKREAEKTYRDLLFAALAASPSSERQDVGGGK